MKRKLIEQLLSAGDLDQEVSRLLPEAAEDHLAARAVLVAAVLAWRATGTASAQDVYRSVCESTPAQVAEALQGSANVTMPKAQLARAQSILTELLTSKAGRPRTSGLSRQEQNALAQSRLRDRLAREGRRRLNIWISPDAASYLDAIKTARGCESQADALELVLESAMKANILQPESLERDAK